MRALLFLLLLPACTEQARVKMYGGTMTVDLPCGQKLTEVTWKDVDLWYAMRPMRVGEIPETTTFQEQSAFGVLEGNVTFKECR